MKVDSPTSLLIVEDNLALTVAYREYLHHEPCNVCYVDTGEAALEHLQRKVPDAMLLDLSLPDMNGMDILKHVYETQLPCAVVIVTGHGSINLAVEAMRYKAFDFIEKPFDGQRLIITLRNALRYQKLSRTLQIYREQFEREQYYDLIGASPPMQTIYRIIENAASSKATVFITGESGTGKELCAEAIHKKSPRFGKPFIALNCAAIPRELMESEIFGHVKGAFTGALKEREGAALQANGGTLFLDEIGDMYLDLQSKLLRFIQTGVVQKVGTSRPQEVDVRFICATNHDPLIDVQQGRFREDLYYRLHVIPLVLPPLREREGDILLIARKFLERFSQQEHKSFQSIAPETEEIFLRYDWPGNVRQLQNVIHNIVVLNEADRITPDMLPSPLKEMIDAHASRKLFHLSDKTAPVTSAKPTLPVSIRPLRLVEKEAIEQAIELCEGNIPKAAALLEVSPSTIYRKRQSWESEKKN